MRILVYMPDDDGVDSFSNKINSVLPENKHELIYAHDVDDFMQMSRLYSYDGAILCIEDKNPSVKHLLTEFMKSGTVIPVIGLTQNISPELSLSLWKSGISTLIPLDDSNLLPEAMSNLIRLRNGHSVIIESGAFRYDDADKSVWFNEHPLQLTAYEKSVFSLLIKNEGKAVSIKTLYESVYKIEDDGHVNGTNLINVFMVRIRAKIAEIDKDKEYIETVRGIGYKFSSEGSTPNPGYIKKFGPLSINYTDLEVTWENQPIQLTLNEYLVLKEIAFHYPESIGIAELVSTLNRFGRSSNEATVTHALYTLGRKLTDTSPTLDGLVKKQQDGMLTFNMMRIDPKMVPYNPRINETIGPFSRNTTLEEIVYNGKLLDLKPSQYQLLSILLDSYPALMSRAQLSEKMYGDVAKATALTPHLSSLIRILKEAAPQQDMLVNRRGLGYVLQLDEKKLAKKFAQAAESVLIEKGPWQINPARYEASYVSAAGVSTFTLTKARFELLKDLVEAYPLSISLEDTGRKQIFYQLVDQLKQAIPDWDDNITLLDHKRLRINIAVDNIPAHILEECEVLSAGPWECNTTLDQVFFDGDPIKLSDTQYKLLKTLIDSYPRVLSKEQLAQNIGLAPISLAATIGILKKHLADKHQITMEWLETIRGTGYALNIARDELNPEKVSVTHYTEMGEIKLNNDLKQLEKGNSAVKLKNSEYAVLTALMEARTPLLISGVQAALSTSGHSYQESSIRIALSKISEKLLQLGFEKDQFLGHSPGGYYLTGRLAELQENSPKITVGPVVIDPIFSMLTHYPYSKHKSYSCTLTPSELSLLEALSRNPRVPLDINDVATLKTEEGEPFSESALRLVKSRIHTKLKITGDPLPDILSVKHGKYSYAHMADSLDTTRIGNDEKPSLEIESGNLKFNTITRVVSYNGDTIDTVKGPAFDLLIMLSKHFGEVCSSEELAKEFLGKSDPDSAKKIVMGMSSLRHMFNKSSEGLGDKLLMSFRDNQFHALCPDIDTIAIMRQQEARDAREARLARRAAMAAQGQAATKAPVAALLRR